MCVCIYIYTALWMHVEYTHAHVYTALMYVCMYITALIEVDACAFICRSLAVTVVYICHTYMTLQTDLTGPGMETSHDQGSNL